MDNKLLGYDEFLLMALQKEGPLSLLELEEQSMIFISRIWYQQWEEQDNITEKFILNIPRLRYFLQKRGKNDKSLGEMHTVSELKKLIEMGFVYMEDEKYHLTPKGEKLAQKEEKNTERMASTVQHRVFNASAAALNTVLVDFILAIMKLSAGFITGSVGILADGVDAASDTISAVLVWVGIKYKKETISTFLVITMLFVASLSVGYESVTKLIATFLGTASAIDLPELVILVECVALAAAVFLFFYQRMVGRASGSLTIISQSVDSKNHIYVSLAVITGALFSIFGIYYVDALIGTFVSARIFLDAVGLTRDAISKYKGEETDLSKYSVPLKNLWKNNRLKSFRVWILFAIIEEKTESRTEIIQSLKRAFHKHYVPVLTELKAFEEEVIDFEKEFDDIVKPLLEKEYLKLEEDAYQITRKGLLYFKRMLSNFRYYDIHLTDAILLEVGEEESKED
ncbi:MAG: cation transporter [Methanomicrobiales archaeon]